MGGKRLKPKGQWLPLCRNSNHVLLQKSWRISGLTRTGWSPTGIIFFALSYCYCLPLELGWISFEEFLLVPWSVRVIHKIQFLLHSVKKSLQIKHLTLWTKFQIDSGPNSWPDCRGHLCVPSGPWGRCAGPVGGDVEHSVLHGPFPTTPPVSWGPAATATPLWNNTSITCVNPHIFVVIFPVYSCAWFKTPACFKPTLRGLWSPPGHVAVVPNFGVTEDIGEFLGHQCSDLLHWCAQLQVAQV